MNKYICIKTIFGLKEINNSYIRKTTSEDSNFCISEGLVVHIDDDDHGDLFYIDIFDEDFQMLGYFQWFDINSYFMTIAEWRDKQINSILDD